jgi:DNA-directed RNA polymerases I and III subunit RPAC1
MNILDQPDKDTLVFEMINVDVSFANAVRRILLANIPTVAIEKIFLFNNTSIIHDEVLSHRIGLIPLDIDARLFDNLESGDDETDRNTVVFNLNVACETPSGNKNNGRSKSRSKGKKAAVDAEDAGETSKAGLLVNKGEPYTMNIYSRHLQWVPQGDQERFLADRPPRPLHDDILIAQLRPGQAIELQAHAIRGIDHAKYSPVATASYRLLPQIELLEDIPAGPDADDLMNLYEPGVFTLNDQGVVVVKNVYACTMSRNFMRNPTLKRAIRMTRVPNHFIFSVESVGAYPPGVLVSQALGILQQKCHRLLDLVDGTDHVVQDA